MNFRLEPWEVPPGAAANNLSVAIEFGPVEWNGEPTMVSARWLELGSGEALAFFRPHCAHINYVVLDDDDGLLHEKYKSANSKTLEWRARQGIMNSALYCGRLFYCHSESLIFREGCVYWENQDFWLREYPLEIPFDANTKASIHVFDWLQTQWNNANSELHIAWQWSRKTDSERIRWLGTIVPRWNELHDLMSAASCVAELPTDERWIMNHFDTNIQTPELLGDLQTLRKLFHASFWFEPLPESYPKFLREYFQLTARHVQVQGTESTAHEKLEARLFLRDWLAQNAPDKLHLVQ